MDHNKINKLFYFLGDSINNGVNDELINFFANNHDELELEYPRTIEFIDSNKLIINLKSTSIDHNLLLGLYFEMQNIFNQERFDKMAEAKSNQTKIVNLEIDLHDTAVLPIIFSSTTDNCDDVSFDSIERLIIDRENNLINYKVVNGSDFEQNHEYKIKQGLDSLLGKLNDEISDFDESTRISSDPLIQLKVNYNDGTHKFFFYNDTEELPSNWKVMTSLIKDSFNKRVFTESIFDIEPPEKEYLICKVRFGNYGNSYSYLVDDETLSSGDRVLVPVGNDGKQKEVTVDSVGKYTDSTSSYPISKMKHVIAKVNKSYDYYEDGIFDDDSSIEVEMCSKSNVKSGAVVGKLDGNLTGDGFEIINENNKCLINYSEFNDDFYKSILDFVKKNKMHSLAIPGSFDKESNYPIDQIATLALQSISDWLESNEDYEVKVSIVCEDDTVYDAYYEFIDMYEGNNDYILEAVCI
ncbi:hypothetical protein [Companilactobacillus insicii]|uniref:hypothetical protein n=1 Tax=Companilactobacillus insicii TaxID=1732567 RepID=UPI000F78BD8B|nr:hypothetical protein [Companilactobacillus insicii]